MPELPEVETVRRTLIPNLQGRTIADVEVHYLPMLTGKSLDEFRNSMIGRTFIDVFRRGKYLIFQLDRGRLIVHLRMEGKFFFRSGNIPKAKHEHVIIRFEDGGTLRYDDVRKFGTMELLEDGQPSVSGLSTLGPEPIDEDFSWRYLKAKFLNSKRPIKGALLDQSVVAGLGNIYVDETLFMSRVHPMRPAGTLKEVELKRIAASAKSVLEKAIGVGGASVHSFTYGDGVTGLFQNQLMVHTKKGEPCPVCGTTILKTKVSGRGTYLCPKCQK